MTETVLFNREYCHLSLFYLTFTLFFFLLDTAKLSWMACKNYINEKIPMWRLFISSMMGSLTITYMRVNATAWHILTHSLATQRANKGPIEKTEISIPNGLMEGSCE